MMDKKMLIAEIMQELREVATSYADEENADDLAADMEIVLKKVLGRYDMFIRL